MKRILVVCLILLLAVAGRYGYHALERARIERSEREVEAKIARLEKAMKTTVSLTEMAGIHPLDQVVRQLGKVSGVPIELDSAALAADGSDPKMPVTVPDRQVSLRAALRLVANSAEVIFDEREGTILFTTPDVSDTSLVTRYYPLPSLPSGAVASDDEWAEAISSSVCPSSWEDVGGPGHYDVLPGAVLVTNTVEIHARLADFFEQIRHPCRASAASPFILPASPADERIQAALLKPASVFFKEMPLDEVAKFLSDHYDVPVLLDRWKLEEAAIAPEVPITCTLREISLRSILTIMLDEWELTFIIRDGVVKITTPEDAESQSFTIVYDVRELMGGPDDFDALDELIDTITSVASPRSWDEVGGPGSLQKLGNGLLILSQTADVHLQVANFLTALTAALHAEPSDELRRAFVPIYDSAAEGKLFAALEQEVRLDYGTIQLDHLCEALSQATGVNVVRSVQSLEQTGVSSYVLVECQLPKMPLGEGLEILLKPLGFTPMIRHEAIEIVNREDAESFQETWMYDIRSFDPALASIDSAHSSDDLIDFLERTIDSESWDFNGGPGVLTRFQGILIAGHDAKTQRKLARALAILAEIERSPDPGNPNEPPRWLTLSAAERELAEGLSKPISLKLESSSLRAALDEIAQELGCDWKYRVKGETAAQQRALDESLTCEFHDVPAAAVLRELLGAKELSFDLARGRLDIVSFPQSRMHVRLYPIADRVVDAKAADRLADLMHLRPPFELIDTRSTAWRGTHLAVAARIGDHGDVAAYLRELRHLRSIKPPASHASPAAHP
jgi:hypothetical protein